jgi:hypothetical protein
VPLSFRSIIVMLSPHSAEIPVWAPPSGAIRLSLIASRLMAWPQNSGKADALQPGG